MIVYIQGLFVVGALYWYLPEIARNLRKIVDMMEKDQDR